MLDNHGIEKALKELPVNNPQIEVHGGGKEIVVSVTSDTFKEMNEAKRQAMVWDHLRSRYAPSDLVAIEFILVNAPGEDTSDQE